MTLNDVKAAKLFALGYTGALNDAELQFWLNFDPSSAVTLQAIQSLQGTDGSKYVRSLIGEFNGTSDGTNTIFTIAHGAETIPVYANVAAINANATGTRFVTKDATNITVTFDTPPAPGTVSLEWIVLVE